MLEPILAVVSAPYILYVWCRYSKSASFEVPDSRSDWAWLNSNQVDLAAYDQMADWGQVDLAGFYRLYLVDLDQVYLSARCSWEHARLTIGWPNSWLKVFLAAWKWAGPGCFRPNLPGSLTKGRTGTCLLRPCSPDSLKLWPGCVRHNWTWSA